MVGVEVSYGRREKWVTTLNSFDSKLQSLDVARIESRFHLLYFHISIMTDKCWTYTLCSHSDSHRVVVNKKQGQCEGKIIVKFYE